MRIMVIDGQGGGMGKGIIERLKATIPAAEIIAVGTNAAATTNMLKGGADIGATGENSIMYNSGNTDVIVGSIDSIFPNAMYGEITPNMALAITTSKAELVLIPVTKSHVHLAGLEDKMMARFLDDAVRLIKNISNRTH